MPRRTASETPLGRVAQRGNSACASQRRASAAAACTTPTHMNSYKRRSDSLGFSCAGAGGRHLFSAAPSLRSETTNGRKTAHSGYAAHTISSASHSGAAAPAASTTTVPRRRSSVAVTVREGQGIPLPRKTKKRRPGTPLGLNSSGKAGRARLLEGQAAYDREVHDRYEVPRAVSTPFPDATQMAMVSNPVAMRGVRKVAQSVASVVAPVPQVYEDCCTASTSSCGSANTAPQENGVGVVGVLTSPGLSSPSWQVMRFSSDVVVGENGVREKDFGDDSDIASSVSSSSSDDEGNAYYAPPTSPLVFRAGKKGLPVSSSPRLSPTSSGSPEVLTESDAHASGDESSSEEGNATWLQSAVGTTPAWRSRVAPAPSPTILGSLNNQAKCVPAYSALPGPLPTSTLIRRPATPPAAGLVHPHPSTPPVPRLRSDLHDILHSGVEARFLQPRWPPHSTVLAGARAAALAAGRGFEKTLTSPVHSSPGKGSPKSPGHTHLPTSSRQRASTPRVRSPSSNTSPSHSVPRARTRKAFPLVMDALADFAVSTRKRKKFSKGYCYEDVMFFKLQAPYMGRKGRKGKKGRKVDAKAASMSALQALQFGFPFGAVEGGGGAGSSSAKGKGLGLLPLSLPMRSGNGFTFPTTSPRVYNVSPRGGGLKRSNSQGGATGTLSLRSRYESVLQPFAQVCQKKLLFCALFI